LLKLSGERIDKSSKLPQPDLYLFTKKDFAADKTELGDSQRRCLTALNSHVSLRHASFISSVESFCSASYSLLDRCTSTAGSFPGDLEILKTVQLHATLISDSRQTLFDAIPHSRLLDFHSNFVTQTSEIREKLDPWKKQADLLTRESLISLAQIGANLDAVRKSELGGVLLEEALGRSKRSLAQISHIGKMQTAYEKSLVEISRRKRFKLRYAAQMEALRAECEAMRAEEDERRRKFSNKYGCHLPINLIPGLTDSVAPVLTVLQGDFDSCLPEISVSLAETPESSDIFLSASFSST